MSTYLPIDREAADAVCRRNIVLKEILDRLEVRIT